MSADLSTAVQNSFAVQHPTLWYPMINTADKAADNVDSEIRVTRCNYKIKLLIFVFEQGTTLVWMVKRRSCRKVSVGWLATLLYLDQEEKYKTLICFTVGRSLLIRKGYKPHVGHYHTAIRRNASLGYFSIQNA